MSPLPKLNEEQKKRSAYGAIRGYLYQFEHSALAILRSGRATVARIEGLEDLDLQEKDTTNAIQIKYWESKTSFTNKAVAKPLLSMYKSFEKNRSLNFTLYVHFGGAPAIPSSLTVADIRESFDLVDDDSMSDSLLKEFADSVEVISGPKIEDQEEELARVVAKELGCDIGEARELHVPRAVYYIGSIATEESEEKRTIQRDDLIRAIEGREYYFHKWQAEYLSHEHLVVQLTKQLKQAGFSDHYHDRVLGVSIAEEDIEGVLDIIGLLSQHFRSGKALTSHKPWTLVVAEKQAGVYDQIKERLVSKTEIEFNDGREDIVFSSKRFVLDPLLIRKEKSEIIKCMSFQLRMVSYKNYDSLKEDERSEIQSRACWFGLCPEFDKFRGNQDFTIAGLPFKQLINILREVAWHE